MNIKIFVHLDDGSMFSATALSFERAQEELAALERKVEKMEEPETV